MRTQEVVDDHVAVYVRVSTLNQVQAQTIDQQLQRLRVHIEAQGWQLADEHIFRDDGRSGANLTDRPTNFDAVRWGNPALAADPSRPAGPQLCPTMILLEEFACFGCQVEFLIV
ncbi:MAG: recombinase family protein [Anaerolineae bacterium]